MRYNRFRKLHLLENEIFVDCLQSDSCSCPASLWRLRTEATRGEENAGQGLVGGLLLYCPSYSVFESRERDHQSREPGKPLISFQGSGRKREEFFCPLLEVEDI